jgi:prepilin-type N-terminal cleavage/methylation domain-containing protein
MAKKVVKITMPICIAPMRIDVFMYKCVDMQMRRCAALIRPSTYSRISGFTMTELVVVLVIISLFMMLAVTNFSGLLRRSTFKAQANELVSTMQMAASAAAESDRRYEVIIDIAQQCYTLRQITSPQLPSDVLEEEIIAKNDFSGNCRVVYVLFDDLVSTDEEHQKAFFRAGHAGWQAGGKIVLLDENEQPYSVVVNRLNRIVTLQQGDVELLMPKRQDEVPF